MRGLRRQAANIKLHKIRVKSGCTDLVRFGWVFFLVVWRVRCPFTLDDDGIARVQAK